MQGDIPALPATLPAAERAAAQDDGNSLARKENDPFDRERSGHRVEKAALRNELARAHIANTHADRDMRVKYAGRIMLYLESYSAGVVVLLLLTGFRLGGFHLERGVVSTLVGSTAIAAIGLVGIITRGQFRPPPPPLRP